MLRCTKEIVRFARRLAYRVLYSKSCSRPRTTFVRAMCKDPRTVDARCLIYGCSAQSSCTLRAICANTHHASIYWRPGSLDRENVGTFVHTHSSIAWRLNKTCMYILLGFRACARLMFCRESEQNLCDTHTYKRREITM